MVRPSPAYGQKGGGIPVYGQKGGGIPAYGQKAGGIRNAAKGHSWCQVWFVMLQRKTSSFVSWLSLLHHADT